MVTILDLSFDCTRLVFDHFTLNEMIHFRRVCPTWNATISAICAQKQILYIFFDHSMVANYLRNNILGINHQCTRVTSQNTLIISQQAKYFAVSPLGLGRKADGTFCELKNNLNDKFRFITRLFVSVSHFVYEFKQNLMNEMNYFLWKWSASLESFVLFTPTVVVHMQPEPFRIFQQVLADLWQCFEQMSELRNFQLLNSNFANFELPNNSQTIGKLEEFTFENANCQLAPFYDQLKNCKHLRVGKCAQDALLNLTVLNSQQTCNLTHLSIYFHSNSLSQYSTQNLLSVHCDQFKNLSYLEVLDQYLIQDQLRISDLSSNAIVAKNSQINSTITKDENICHKAVFVDIRA